MSQTGIDLFTPEGDPRAISCRRRAAPRMGGHNRRDILSPPPLLRPPLFVLLSSSSSCCFSLFILALRKLRFLTSSFAAVTIMAFTTGVSRLNSRIYELHRRVGAERERPARNHFRRRTIRARVCTHACVRVYIYIYSDSR